MLKFKIVERFTVQSIFFCFLWKQYLTLLWILSIKRKKNLHWWLLVLLLMNSCNLFESSKQTILDLTHSQQKINRKKMFSKPKIQIEHVKWTYQWFQWWFTFFACSRHIICSWFAFLDWFFVFDFEALLWKKKRKQNDPINIFFFDQLEIGKANPVGNFSNVSGETWESK